MRTAARFARIAPPGPRKSATRRPQSASAKAQSKDNLGALGRFAAVHDGVARLNAEPPLVVPLRDLLDDPVEAAATEDAIRHLLRTYGDTLEPERRILLDRPTWPLVRRRSSADGSAR